MEVGIERYRRHGSDRDDRRNHRRRGLGAGRIGNRRDDTGMMTIRTGSARAIATDNANENGIGIGIGSAEERGTIGRGIDGGEVMHVTDLLNGRDL
jgi:hypothetical protein